MKFVLGVMFLCQFAAATVAKATTDQEIEHLKANDIRQQNTINSLTEKVEFLMKQMSVGRQAESEVPAFTAYLDHEEPVHPNGALKFNKVLYNNGHAYNVFTGIFTVPFNGTYMFSFQIEHWTATADIRGAVVVDGVQQVAAIINSHGSYSTQSGNTAVLGLTAGQSVWIACSEGTLLGSPTSHYTVFTGALLHMY